MPGVCRNGEDTSKGHIWRNHESGCSCMNAHFSLYCLILPMLINHLFIFCMMGSATYVWDSSLHIFCIYFGWYVGLKKTNWLLFLSFSIKLSLYLCNQVQRVVTCSSTTCHRSLETMNSCKCFCPSVPSSPLRSSWTGQPTRASALVSPTVQHAHSPRPIWYNMILYQVNLYWLYLVSLSWEIKTLGSE